MNIKINTSAGRPFLLVGLFCLIISSLHAQEDVSDQELLQYATVMVKIDSMKEEARVAFNDLVKSDTLMAGGRRFMDIEAAKGDTLKLAELKIEQHVLEAYKLLLDEYQNLESRFKESAASLVKEELGVDLYNKVRARLKSDKSLEIRYQEVFSQLLPGAKKQDFGEADGE